MFEVGGEIRVIERFAQLRYRTKFGENLAYARHRGWTASKLRLGHRPDGAAADHLDGRPSPISHHVRSGTISGGCHHESGRPRPAPARLPPRALGRHAADRDRPCPRPRSGALLPSNLDITLACPVRWAIINAGALQARQRRAVITRCSTRGAAQTAQSSEATRAKFLDLLRLLMRKFRLIDD
jgi:hypothetical protein